MKKINDMLMLIKDEKILLVIEQFRWRVWELWLQVIERVVIHQLRRYTETFLSHQQCRWIIDEKISGRIVISSDESESRDYNARRSSDSLITLIYWRDLSSSSLLDVKSYIYLRGKLRVQENDQNVWSTIDQSHSLNDCNRTSILTIYSTSTWHKSREEKNYSVQSHFTFSLCAPLFHHIFLCSMNDNHWAREHSYTYVTITSITSAKKTYVTITSITSAKKTSFIFESRIESRHCL